MLCFPFNLSNAKVDIGIGHIYFALGFAIVFLFSMAVLYRRDLQRLRRDYKQVYKVFILVASAVALLLVVKELTVS